MTLGKPDAVKAAQARAAALAFLAREKDGGQPVPLPASGPTLTKFAAEYVERRSPSWKPSTVAATMSYLNSAILPAVGHLRDGAVVRADIARFFHEYGRRKPGGANRSHDILRSMFDCAIAWGHRPEAAGNPCAGIVRYHIGGRPRRTVMSIMTMRRLVRPLSVWRSQLRRNYIIAPTMYANPTIVSGNSMPARAPRNRTMTCTPEELLELSEGIIHVEKAVDCQDIDRQLIKGDFFEIADFLPEHFIDLLILDPPYNLTKNYNGNYFRRRDKDSYTLWFRRAIELLIPMMKPNATVYACSDWKTSTLVLPVLEERLFVRNRITWEREKGRGAKRNWKNNTEDIWFCTNSEDYYFDVESVKLKRRVLAPYRVGGEPKDWQQENDGNYRLTHPSNIWTDLTVPFWSMPENTPHPAQKPEKLLAKLVLASSKENDFVFDPFLGSGTTAVVAEKLGRKWCGIDINSEYLCWAKKRICVAQGEPGIQGYSAGVFWERNSVPQQRKASIAEEQEDASQGALFK
ncbi:MAG: site-specific DNA-methyltransferase [Gammaproteobacteria bacterium]|nr:site-specific DNA-methyltransferase [Gammaproteobacteria bacterium]